LRGAEINRNETMNLESQAIVATSTTEAEYIAGGMVVKEALWVRKLLGDITGRDPSMALYCDNRSAMKIITQHTAAEKGRTKHIDIQYHFIKERFHRGEIDIEYVESSQQLADLFTNALPGPAFRQAIMNHLWTHLTPLDICIQLSKVHELELRNGAMPPPRQSRARPRLTNFCMHGRSKLGK
jgi:hypothetical protein